MTFLERVELLQKEMEEAARQDEREKAAAEIQALKEEIELLKQKCDPEQEKILKVCKTHKIKTAKDLRGIIRFYKDMP